MGETMVGKTDQLGDWDAIDSEATLSYQRMDLSSRHLARHWRRCSQSADLWARYGAFFVPVPVPAAHGLLNRAAVTHVVSYLLNELFENCAKFSAGPVSAVRYECWVQPGELVFALTNHAAPGQREPFLATVRELLDGDPEEAYFRRIEEAAESNQESSGIGYLTLVNDYGVRFGFQVSQETEDSIAIRVRARVSLEEV